MACSADPTPGSDGNPPSLVVTQCHKVKRLPNPSPAEGVAKAPLPVSGSRAAL